MQVYRVEVGAGNEIWRDENGSFHREGGPACKHANGDKVWFWHGKYHREDGPALEYTDGTKIWYVHNERHREDGPAYEGFDGHKVWYLHDKLFVDEEDWEQAKQAKVSPPSCEGKIVEIDGEKYKLTSV